MCLGVHELSVVAPFLVSSNVIEVRFTPARDLTGRTTQGVITRLPSVGRVRGCGSWDRAGDSRPQRAVDRIGHTII
jgi:hypothetical protein